MTLVLLIAGTLSLLVGLFFFWANNNTPLQTRLPAIFLPLGVVLGAVLLGTLL